MDNIANFESFAKEILQSDQTVKNGSEYINYLVDDESVWEKITFIPLSSDEFANELFYGNKCSYREKLERAIEILGILEFEDYLVHNGNLYVKNLFNTEDIFLIKYGIYKF